jgi:hypothetical protein
MHAGFMYPISHTPYPILVCPIFRTLYRILVFGSWALYLAPSMQARCRPGGRYSSSGRKEGSLHLLLGWSRCLLPPPQVGYFHGYVDGVDFVFVDHPCFHNRGSQIYGGSREELLFRCALLCKVRAGRGLGADEGGQHVECFAHAPGHPNARVCLSVDWQQDRQADGETVVASLTRRLVGGRRGWVGGLHRDGEGPPSQNLVRRSDPGFSSRGRGLVAAWGSPLVRARMAPRVPPVPPDQRQWQVLCGRPWRRAVPC